MVCSNIDLTLENEIRVNIKRVAEGHLDISRAVSLSDRQYNILESELRKIKERLDYQIA